MNTQDAFDALKAMGASFKSQEDIEMNLAALGCTNQEVRSKIAVTILKKYHTGDK